MDDREKYNGGDGIEPYVFAIGWYEDWFELEPKEKGACELSALQFFRMPVDPKTNEGRAYARQLERLARLPNGDRMLGRLMRLTWWASTYGREARGRLWRSPWVESAMPATLEDVAQELGCSIEEASEDLAAMERCHLIARERLAVPEDEIYDEDSSQSEADDIQPCLPSTYLDGRYPVGSDYVEGTYPPNGQRVNGLNGLTGSTSNDNKTGLTGETGDCAQIEEYGGDEDGTGNDQEPAERATANDLPPGATENGCNGEIPTADANEQREQRARTGQPAAVNRQEPALSPPESTGGGRSGPATAGSCGPPLGVISQQGQGQRAREPPEALVRHQRAGPKPTQGQWNLGVRIFNALGFGPYDKNLASHDDLQEIGAFAGRFPRWRDREGRVDAVIDSLCKRATELLRRYPSDRKRRAATWMKIAKDAF